jgi:hypothetical protein
VVGGVDGIQPAVRRITQPATTIHGRRLFYVHMKGLACALVPICFAACGEGRAAATQDSFNRAQPGYIVDSILPIEEQLRRFRADLPDSVRQLEGGAPTRDALVRSFVRSLESADTAALARLTISRAEFAWLVYPDSPFTRPPYQQAPHLVWMMHMASSSTGLRRLLERLGGKNLGFESWSCAVRSDREGENRIWRDCFVRFEAAPTSSGALQLFSSIIERQGRFKILSYANAF